MSVHVVYSCDGRRSGQPCRGALHTRTADQDDAHQEAAAAGWRDRLVVVPGSEPSRYRVDVRCPSPGHDEDQPPAEWHDGPQGGTAIADPLSGLLAPWPPRHADDRPPP